MVWVALLGVGLSTELIEVEEVKVVVVMLLLLLLLLLIRDVLLQGGVRGGVGTGMVK